MLLLLFVVISSRRNPKTRNRLFDVHLDADVA